MKYYLIFATTTTIEGGGVGGKAHATIAFGHDCFHSYPFHTILPNTAVFFGGSGGVGFEDGSRGGYRNNNNRKYRRIATAMIAIETRNVVHCLAEAALETSCIAAGFSSAIEITL